MQAHLDHARGFARALARVARVAASSPEPARALDLGSGGGVPGLALAELWPRSTWTLLEVSERRADFLRDAVATLGMVGRVGVLTARAEVAGRDVDHRGRYDVVTARAFGPPSVTAECGSPFLGVGGLLLVSEPPVPVPGRWPDDGLALLGLEVRVRPVAKAAEPAITVLEQVRGVGDRFPRRTGVPAKRPLWR